MTQQGEIRVRLAPAYLALLIVTLLAIATFFLLEWKLISGPKKVGRIEFPDGQVLKITGRSTGEFNYSISALLINKKNVSATCDNAFRVHLQQYAPPVQLATGRRGQLHTRFSSR